MVCLSCPGFGYDGNGAVKYNSSDGVDLYSLNIRTDLPSGFGPEGVFGLCASPRRLVLSEGNVYHFQTRPLIQK